MNRRKKLSNALAKSAAILFFLVFGLRVLLIIPNWIRQHATETSDSIMAQSTSTAIPEAQGLQLKEGYGKLPMIFEANKGQADERVKFISRGKGYTLFLTSTESVLSLVKPNEEPRKPSKKFEQQTAKTLKNDCAVLRMKLVDANPTPRISGLDKLSAKGNYFTGKDPQKWQTNVPNYSKVIYGDIYPGVDLIFHGNQRNLEYDFIVAPGANPEAIRLCFEGIEQVSIDDTGDLLLETAGGKIRQQKPIVYQEVNGTKRHISGGYLLKEENHVGFQIASYDASKPVIIDPVLTYSTYVGGGSGQIGLGIAVDGDGNVYVTGATTSTNFPTENPFQGTYGGAGVNNEGDAFIFKLNPTGDALIYSTYLGGSSDDEGLGIAVDASGQAHVVGSTLSDDFPITANALQDSLADSHDAFITKLSAEGNSLVYSTYLGGSSSEGLNGLAIAVDDSGKVYLTGDTSSENFPTTPGTFQPAPSRPISFPNTGEVFVAKLDLSESVLDFSTYLSGDKFEAGTSIAVDRDANVYVSGRTRSSDFPTMNPFQSNHGGDFDDVFVTKLNSTGSALIYSTYIGGQGNEEANGMVVDNSGSAYLVGYTNSFDFPTENPFQTNFNGGGDRFSGDAFVTKLSSDGSSLIYSTYLGSAGGEQGFGIAIDASGSAYVTGRTDSVDFLPVPHNFPTENPIQATLGGFIDAFVTKLSPSGSTLEFSTYLGGSDILLGNLVFGDVGIAITVDDQGDAYVTGGASSNDFPTVNPFQATKGGLTDVFVSKITSAPTSVDEITEEIPTSFELAQNYPNPFNPTTTIRFYLPIHTTTNLKVYDMLGREVKILLEGDLQPGEHSVLFDAKELASGVYVYRLETEGFVQQRKMVLLR